MKNPSQFASKILASATICAALLGQNLIASDKAASEQVPQKYDAEAIANVFYALNGDAKDPHKKINHTNRILCDWEVYPTKRCE